MGSWGVTGRSDHKHNTMAAIEIWWARGGHGENEAQLDKSRIRDVCYSDHLRSDSERGS